MGRGTQRRFQGKVGLIGAVTDAIDRVADEIGDLGPRMLLFRMPDADEDTAMIAAARNAGHQSEMHAELADCISHFVTGLDCGHWPLAPEPDVPELRALARWVVWCRSPVLRDPWGEIEHVPRPEAGMRVYASLLQLAAGAFIIGLDNATTDALVRQVALDSIPSMRRRVLDELLSGASGRTTRTLSDALGLPISVVWRVWEDLATLGWSTAPKTSAAASTTCGSVTTPAHSHEPPCFTRDWTRHSEHHPGGTSRPGGDVMDRLTLDTNVVRDLWRDDQRWRKTVGQLLALAEAGKVDLVVTSYIQDDVPRGALAHRISALGELGIHRTGGVFQLDVSRLNGRDGLGDQAVIDLERQLRAVALATGAKLPGETDWLHLHAHRNQRLGPGLWML
jgi:hypothetical protein